MLFLRQPSRCRPPQGKLLCIRKGPPGAWTLSESQRVRLVPADKSSRIPPTGPFDVEDML